MAIPLEYRYPITIFGQDNTVIINTVQQFTVFKVLLHAIQCNIPGVKKKTQIISFGAEDATKEKFHPVGMIRDVFMKEAI